MTVAGGQRWKPVRPEHAAGGFAADDGTVQFYQRIAAVCPDNAVVLDLGAGRGVMFDNEVPGWRSFLLRFAGKCSRRVGADVDEAIARNPALDEYHIIKIGAPLPFGDQTFDVVLCDWVVEHIDDPEAFISEIRRVLKVGGWFCARTPNRWSYFAVGASILPKQLEDRVLKMLQPNRLSEDVFPKRYKLNTLSALSKILRPDQWLNATYTFNPEPAYYGGRRWLYSLLTAYQAILPASLRSNVLIFAKRQA